MKNNNINILNSKTSRYIGIDLIKTLAIFFVISVHFFLNTKFYRTNLNNTNLFIQTFFQQIFLSCIPLFIISTGFLNNHTNIDKKYFKKIIPIILIYIIYFIPSILYRYKIKEIQLDILLWIKLLFSFKGHRYSWYINLYFGLFLLIPFLNRMYHSLHTKEEKQALIFILILLTSFTSLKVIPNYWKNIYPFTYFFIGKYIKDFQPKLKNKNTIIFLLIIILIQTIIEFKFANNLYYKHILTDYTSIFRLIQSLLIFLLLYNKNINNPFLITIITNISKITLDIYLASFFSDRFIYSLVKPYNFSQEFYFLFFIPLVLSSFFIAFIISSLRLKYIKIKQ